MTGEKNLETLLKTMQPELNPGEFVFCTINSLASFTLDEIVSVFKEEEGITVIITKELADSLKLTYSFVASWITLKVHSSLEAVGLTAAFSKVLAEKGISCNVIAAFYHDHIFVDIKDSDKAMKILAKLSAPKKSASNN